MNLSFLFIPVICIDAKNLIFIQDRIAQLVANNMNTVNFAYNDTRPGIRKVSLFAKCRYTRSLIIMYYSWMGLCSGHGHSVVIRKLPLYPQSLLAKLTVVNMLFSRDETIIPITRISLINMVVKTPLAIWR